MRRSGRTFAASIAADRGRRIPLWGSMSSNGEAITTLSLDGDNEISLLEILDHVLNSGVVIHGSIVISLAGVDLVYLGLNVILTSVETALRNMNSHEFATASQVRRSV